MKVKENRGKAGKVEIGKDAVRNILKGDLEALLIQPVDHSVFKYGFIAYP